MYYESNNSLIHYGIKGQKWGVRRYQNADGTLTAKGKKRKAKLDSKIQKQFNKKLSDPKGNFTNRDKVFDKMEKELAETKEGKAYSELVKKRGIKDETGKVTSLSYLKEDWSNPEKVMDQMVKDTDTMHDYDVKTREIGRKYANDFRGAALKDLGYEDTAAGRAYLEELHILDPK